jgi:nicotinamidase/pyrazinamidase
MPGTLFWDMDTQRDFMDVEGRLYVPGAQQILPALRKLTAFLADAPELRRVAAVCRRQEGDEAIAAEKPDYKSSFPPHCLEGSPGAEKIPETACARPLEIDLEAETPEGLTSRMAGWQGELLLPRRSFDLFSNPNTETLLSALAPQALVFYGVAQDLSIRQALEGLIERDRRGLWLITDASRPFSMKLQEKLFEELGEKGVRFTTTAKVIERAADGPLGD